MIRRDVSVHHVGRVNEVDGAQRVVQDGLDVVLVEDGTVADGVY